MPQLGMILLHWSEAGLMCGSHLSHALKHLVHGLYLVQERKMLLAFEGSCVLFVRRGVREKTMEKHI